jgi:hypothetical protein
LQGHILSFDRDALSSGSDDGCNFQQDCFAFNALKMS